MNDRDDTRLASLDANGFLTDPTHWDAHLAARVARRLGVAELSIAHWRIIERLRAGWLAEGELPVQRHLCRDRLGPLTARIFITVWSCRD